LLVQGEVLVLAVNVLIILVNIVLVFR